MKYFIISGEPSGDLHGSKLIKGIFKSDPKAEIAFWGGDLMEKAGGKLLTHYNELAFMGFIEVLLNIFKILKNFKKCKKDILNFNPDKIIYIDYPGFNLRMCKWAKKRGFRNYYYISPQVWAWKEKRAEIIKKYIDEFYVVLPFEKNYFKKKHNINSNYFGHPLIDDIENFEPQLISFNKKPIISILPGSRKQEIKKILSKVIDVCKYFPEFQFVIAGVKHIDSKIYNNIISKSDSNIEIIYDNTYSLLKSSKLAIVTSGTATLETALLNIPQMVCYVTNPVNIFLAKLLVKIKFISLVNLIFDKKVINEFIQSDVNISNIKNEINLLLGEKGSRIKEEYKSIRRSLGTKGVSDRISAHIVNS